jgi:hypothetical protein
VAKKDWINIQARKNLDPTVLRKPDPDSVSLDLKHFFYFFFHPCHTDIYSSMEVLYYVPFLGRYFGLPGPASADPTEYGSKTTTLGSSKPDTSTLHLDRFGLELKVCFELSIILKI